MLIPRETDLAKRIRVTVDELQELLAGEQSQEQARTTNTVAGGIAGAGLGVLSGLGLASGMVPDLEMVASFGVTLPVMLGTFMAGIGAIAGSFVDLSPIANVWRRKR
jgi:hypothetical protein